MNPIMMQPKKPCECILMDFEDPARFGEIIRWLGNDFVALTDGSPITINGNVISSDKNLEGDKGMLLFIRSGNGIHVAGHGEWIVRDAWGYYHTAADIADDYELVNKPE